MKNGSGKLVMYLVGVLVTLVLFIGFPTLVRYVIANDQASRQRDVDLTEALHRHIITAEEKQHEWVVKQEVQNGKTNTTLEKILVELQYIKANGR